MVYNPNTKETNDVEVNNAIFISPENMYYYKYITAEEIDEINKLVGIDNFIGYPEKDGIGFGGDCEKLIEFISIIINEPAFFEFVYKTSKLAIVKLIETIRKRINKNKEKKYIFDFQVKDKHRGLNFSLKIDANASAGEIEGLLDKAKELIEVAKK